MQRRLLTPALAGGAVLGVLSALPVIAWGNACCCLWILLGGAVAAYLLQQQQRDVPLTAIDGVLAGAAAGVAGAFVYLLVSIPVTLLTTPLVEAIRQRLLDANVALPPVLAEASPSALSARNGLLIAGSFLLMLFVGPLFATVGGLLGAMVFRHAPPDIP